MERYELSPSCPLCESRLTGAWAGYQHIGSENWSLYQCASCHTAFINPPPDSSTLARYYDESYYGRGEGKFLAPVEVIVRAFRLLRAKSVHKYMPTGRILDVGCGRGMMLSYFKKWGYEVDGVELDTLAASRAQKNIGQRVFHKIEDISRGPFEAVTFWHSLEHMPDPGRTLKIVYDLLSPEGILIIAAPNMASLQSRMAGHFWLHLDLPRHLVHFHMDHLAHYMETQGYVLLGHHHFSQEYNVIDTLCHLYGLIGFDPLYPFKMIGNVRQRTTRTWSRALGTVLGSVCFTPLTALAFLLANLFSVLRSGSTTTLYLKKKS